MRNWSTLFCSLFLLSILTVDGFGQAKDKPAESTAKDSGRQTKIQESTDGNADQAELFRKFEATMAGAKLIGNFTITGQDTSDLESEEYEIKSVKKLGEGDLWMITARVKYGGKDVTVPMPLEVKWAGDTPVITLTDMEIPLLGTFNARVVIYNGKYAGTWSHGDFGGHLFGKVQAGDAEKTSD